MTVHDNFCILDFLDTDFLTLLQFISICLHTFRQNHSETLSDWVIPTQLQNESGKAKTWT